MNKKNRKLIKKSLKGTLNEREGIALKKWIDDPKNSNYLQEEIQLRHRLNTFMHSFDSNRAYKKNIALRHQRKTRRFPFTSVLKYAAVLLVLVGMTWFFKTVFPPATEQLTFPDEQITLELEDGTLMGIQSGENREIQMKNGELVSIQKQDVLYYDKATGGGSIAYNTLRVPYGKTFKVQLSDSSLVYLNAGTELRYPKQFTGSERRVYLNGEAFFEVQHNEHKPFIVQTTETDIKVLGTKFNVTAYGEEKISATVLVEGSVKVSKKQTDKSSGTSVTLTPGNLARWDKAKEEMTVKPVQVSDYISWMDGKLVFESKTFEEMLRVLERKYNVKIENKYTALDTGRYRGRFQDESIEQIMKTFTQSRLFSYTIKDNTLIIDKPKNE